MAGQSTPEVKAAIMQGAVIDAVLLCVGAVLFYITNQVSWLIVFAVVGSALFFFLLARAGAFRGRDG